MQIGSFLTIGAKYIRTPLRRWVLTPNGGLMVARGAGEYIGRVKPDTLLATGARLVMRLFGR